MIIYTVVVTLYLSLDVSRFIKYKCWKINKLEKIKVAKSKGYDGDVGDGVCNGVFDGVWVMMWIRVLHRQEWGCVLSPGWEDCQKTPTN